MREEKKSVSVLRDLRAVLLVAVGVVAVGTIAGAVTDHIHKVQADEVSAKEVKAVVSGNKQTVTLGQWGLQFVSPFDEADMPQLSYANQSPESVGLSSADLEKLGMQCYANQNALGTIVREAAGSFAKTVAPVGSSVIGTVGDYEYVYNFSQGGCAGNSAAIGIINREESVMLEALSSLGPIAK